MSEDIIKQFYGTLFINSDCTTMEFMIGSKHCEATKKDLENALGINPGDKEIIVLHSLRQWRKGNLGACSLCVVPTANPKEVRNLKPEVNLIQKINRMTLLPRSGAQDGCSDMLLKITHAIYHEKHFDVAHFLISEMRIAIQKPDHALPYGHYIFCLLRHKKFISDQSFSNECSLLEYSPKDMEQLVTIDSVGESIAQLEEKLSEFWKTLQQRFDTLDKRLKKVERLHMEEVISDQSFSNECSLLEYSPKDMEQLVTIDSVGESIAQLEEKLSEFWKTLRQRFDTLDKRLKKVERLHMEEVRRRKDWEKRF